MGELQENSTRSPRCIAPLYILLTSGPCYNNVSTLCPITHPHVFSIRPPCFLHVPWHHTFNLRCTCAHHVYTMRNSCPLTSSPNPNSISRLFPILLDPKSFQTALDYSTWLPGHMPISFHCRLIKYYLIYVWLTLTLAKVCPHSRLITIYVYSFSSTLLS